MNETLGKRVRNRRKQLGRTLTEVAKAAGLSPGFLSDLEHDRSKGTTKLKALADALEVDIDHLLMGSAPQTATGRYKSIITGIAVHGFQLSPEACEFAQEWDKLEEPMRAQILTMVESLVAAQIRKKRRSEKTKSSKESRRDTN